MGQKFGPVKEPAEQVVKEIRRATRRQFSAEEKIRIVLSGLRGEDSIAELCRREGIVQNLYYRWLKEFLEAPFWIGVRSLSWHHLFNQGHGRLPALLLNVSISGTAALTV
jgi:hypothetical protein